MIFATHTGGIMSWRLSTPPPSAGSGAVPQDVLAFIAKENCHENGHEADYRFSRHAILATSADAQTRRTKEVRIQPNNSLSRNSVSRNPVNVVKASHCHFHHGEADPDPQVRLYMTRDCNEHQENE